MNSKWVQVSDGIGTNKIVYCFGCLGFNIFAGTTSRSISDTIGTVHYSTNNGTNLLLFNLRSRNALAFGYSEGSVYAGCEFSEGAYFSYNNGVTWNPTQIVRRSVTSRYLI